jgi:hypothetical protein
LNLGGAINDEEDEETLRPASGLCVGSRFLGGNVKRLLEILSAAASSGFVTQKAFGWGGVLKSAPLTPTNRQAILMAGIDGCLDAHFVDHGYRFGGPKEVKKLHFTSSRYLDPRSYQN